MKQSRKDNSKLIKFINKIDFPHSNPSYLYEYMIKHFCPNEVMQTAYMLVAQQLGLDEMIDKVQKDTDDRALQFNFILGSIFRYMNLPEVVKRDGTDNSIFCGLMFALLSEYKDLEHI